MAVRLCLFGSGTLAGHCWVFVMLILPEMLIFDTSYQISMHGFSCGGDDDERNTFLPVSP